MLHLSAMLLTYSSTTFIGKFGSKVTLNNGSLFYTSINTFNLLRVDIAKGFLFLAGYED